MLSVTHDRNIPLGSHCLVLLAEVWSCISIESELARVFQQSLQALPCSLLLSESRARHRYLPLLAKQPLSCVVVAGYGGAPNVKQNLYECSSM